ncbi:MAG: hypothetical protein WAT47_13570 [Nostocoides sp.]
MGKHSSTNSNLPPILGGAVALALLGGAVYAYASGNEPGTATPSSSATTATSAASGSSSTTTSASPTSTSATPDAEMAAATALASCQGEVAAGERLAKAAAASASDWKTHAGAQISLDNGTISYARATELWAASRANGPRDVQRFVAADTAYAGARGGCDDVDAVTAGTAHEDRARDCQERASVLAELAKAGRTVNTQWADHQEQMATRDTDAGPAYHAEWIHFVEKSRAALGSYATQAKRVAQAPACV